jgi:hypothetical protein
VAFEFKAATVYLSVKTALKNVFLPELRGTYGHFFIDIAPDWLRKNFHACLDFYYQNPDFSR